MAAEPLDVAIPRFQLNEDRVNSWVNGDQNSDMITSGGQSVPSVRKIVAGIQADATALLETKNEEINEAAEGILAGSVSARDKAEKWAVNPLDVVVEGGLFSARHYAAKTAEDRIAVAAALAAAQVTAVPSRAWAIANFHPNAAPDFIQAAGYDASGDYGGALYKKATALVEGRLLPRTVGSVISDMGSAARAFDGQTNAASALSAIGSTPTGYIGKTFPVNQNVTKAVVFGSNDVGFVGSSNPVTTLELYGKNGAAPANATDGTLLGTTSFTDTVNESGGREIASSDTTTQWKHVWVRVSSAGTNTRVAEIQFYGKTTEPAHAGKFSITLADGVTVVWYEISEEEITPKMFGVVFNSALDQTAAMQAWLDAIGVLNISGYIPAGVVKLNGAIASAASGLRVRCHRKTVLDATAAPFGTWSVTLAGTIGPYINGTVGAFVAGTTRIRTGASFAQSLAIGDVIKIKSANNYDAANTNSLYGETNVVVGLADAATGYIDIERPLAGTYSTTPQVAKITAISDAVWDGGKVIGALAEQNSQRGILLAHFKDCKILNFSAERMDDRAIYVRDGLDFEIVPGTISDSRPGGTGYGVSVGDAVNDGSIHHGTFQRIRHSFSTNNGTNLGGVPRRITFADNIISGGAWARTGSMGPGDGIDTHGAAEDIYIERNTVTGCPGQGINFECRSGVIRDNKIINPANNGIAVHNESDLNGSIIVTGNLVRGAGGKGIYIFNGSRGTAAVYDTLICDGNVVDGVVAEGIQIGYAAQPNKARGAVVGRNRVRNAGGIGLYIVNCRNVGATGNNVEGVGTQQAMRLLDCLSFVVNANTLTQPNGGASFGLQISASVAAATLIGQITGNDISAYSGSFSAAGIFLDNNVQYVGVSTNNVRGSAGITMGTGTGNVLGPNIT